MELATPTKFEAWIRDIGIRNVSLLLGVTQPCVYTWLSGTYTPAEANIHLLAKVSRGRITREYIMSHMDYARSTKTK